MFVIVYDFGTSNLKTCLFEAVRIFGPSPPPTSPTNCTPWDGITGPTHRQHLTGASFAADMATFSYLNFNYLFYSCSTSLVGGNGTAWADNKTAYTYFRIDTASTPGFIAAA